MEFNTVMFFISLGVYGFFGLYMLYKLLDFIFGNKIMRRIMNGKGS